MFDPETEVVQLESRLGRVGSIQAWDPWKSRLSMKHAKWWVSKIARLSHGLGEAEDFEAHFDRVVNQLHHESVLEFVPLPWVPGPARHLPFASLRRYGSEALRDLDFHHAAAEREEHPASTFLVEAPIFVARQWMRHRSFAYLEMSRRYTKGSRVAWEFYGQAPDFVADADTDPTSISMGFTPKGATEETHFWEACLTEYQRRLDAGWPNEIARGCMPVEAMTKFWVAGFDRDWEAFLKLRNDAHAQPEIRVFAQWIADHLSKKRGAA